MKTKRLIIDLVAFVLTTAFLLFFLPLAFNAQSTLMNLLGAAVVAGMVIGTIAVFHKHVVVTQTSEDNNEE